MKEVARGLVVAFAAVFVFGQYGCGSASAGETEEVEAVYIENNRLVGLTDELLQGAARQQAQKPLIVVFEASSPTDGPVHAGLELSVDYQPGKKIPWLKAKLADRSVTLRPKFGLDLIERKLAFDIFDDQNRQVVKEGQPLQAVVDLSGEFEQVTRQSDLDELGEWLLKAGAVAIAVVLPLLLAAGVFGVVLVITQGVAQVLGLLLWTIFKLGVIAVAAGLLVKVVQWFVTDATLEDIELWLAGVWQDVRRLAGELMQLTELQSRLGRGELPPPPAF